MSLYKIWDTEEHNKLYYEKFYGTNNLFSLIDKQQGLNKKQRGEEELVN